MNKVSEVLGFFFCFFFVKFLVHSLSLSLSLSIAVMLTCYAFDKVLAVDRDCDVNALRRYCKQQRQTRSSGPSTELVLMTWR